MTYHFVGLKSRISNFEPGTNKYTIAFGADGQKVSAYSLAEADKSIGADTTEMHGGTVDAHETLVAALQYGKQVLVHLTTKTAPETPMFIGCVEGQAQQFAILHIDGHVETTDLISESDLEKLSANHPVREGDLLSVYKMAAKAAALSKNGIAHRADVQPVANCLPASKKIALGSLNLAPVTG